jgi:hypothetical protein
LAKYSIAIGPPWQVASRANRRKEAASTTHSKSFTQVSNERAPASRSESPIQATIDTNDAAIVADVLKNTPVTPAPAAAAKYRAAHPKAKAHAKTHAHPKDETAPKK